MNSHTTSRDRISLWIVLAVGLALLAVAAISRADDYSAAARRTDRFSGAGLTRLSLENVGGDIRVSAGAAFSATADVTVRADTPALAKKYLDATRIELRNDGGGSFSLVTEEPGARVSRHGGGWDIEVHRRGARFRVEARFAVTVPAAAAVDVHTVNGNVSTDGIGGAINARSVNGRVRISGARRDVTAHTVNGAIEASLAELPHGTRIDAETVNGAIELRLPPRAAFDFRGHTMNGDIVSTFPLPFHEIPDQTERMRAEREKVRAEQEKLRREIRMRKEHARKDDDGDVDIDLSGLDEGLYELSQELARIGPEIAAAVSQSLNHTYQGSVGGGGADVRCSTLNGRIAVLAEGTSDERAKSLLPRRGRGTHEAPEPPEPPEAPAVPVPAPSVLRPPRPPRAPRAGVNGGVEGGVAGGVRGGIPGGVRGGVPGGIEEGSIVRGDIAGDFSTTLPFGDVQLGKVSGAVRIVTYGGQIRVAEAGKGADLSTSGGDIQIDGVHGDLRAITHGGELRVGRVTGDAKLETMGGDVDLASCGGSVIAKTGGGDLRLHRIRGSIRASAGGGDVRCEIVGRETSEGVSIASGSGDVTLVLPSNFRADVDIQVDGVDESMDAIVTDFPEISISRRPSSMRQSAGGAINGGGPKVSIRISSGTVRLKKGPPA